MFFRVSHYSYTLSFSHYLFSVPSSTPVIFYSIKLIRYGIKIIRYGLPEFFYQSETMMACTAKSTIKDVYLLAEVRKVHVVPGRSPGVAAPCKSVFPEDPYDITVCRNGIRVFPGFPEGS